MRSGWDRWLRALGSLLPTRVREYVFEPACYDLVEETLEQHRGTRLLVPRIAAILLHVAVVNFPRVLFEGRRPSRLAVVLGSVALFGFLALLSVAFMMRGSYGP